MIDERIFLLPDSPNLLLGIFLESFDSNDKKVCSRKIVFHWQNLSISEGEDDHLLQRIPSDSA